MKICRWHLACTRSRPLALQLWASRGQKVKNVKMRKEREGTKAIDKKCQQDQKLRTKPKNWHDRWDRRSNAGDAILTIVDNVRNWRQHWRYIWYWFWQCWHNVDKMLILHFADLGQFFLHLLIDIWFTFQAFYLSFTQDGTAAAWIRLPRCQGAERWNHFVHNVTHHCTSWCNLAHKYTCSSTLALAHKIYNLSHLISLFSELLSVC